jgi:hypothetical protein
MSDPRAFVSFDFDHDERSKNLFVGQAKSESPTPFTIEASLLMRKHGACRST